MYIYPSCEPLSLTTSLPPQFNLLPVTTPLLTTHHTTAPLPSSQNNPFPARLLANERVTSPSHFQDVRLITMDILDAGIRFGRCMCGYGSVVFSFSYSAGDVLMVQPQNTPSVVDEFLSLLSLDAEQMVSVETTGPSLPPSLSLQVPCSLHSLATHYLDFMSVPRRSFFELLSAFASDDREREKLAELSSTEGQVCVDVMATQCSCWMPWYIQEEYYSYCRRPRRSILEVLDDFPSAVAGLQLSYLLELIPALRPRAFSIASSMAVCIYSQPLYRCTLYSAFSVGSSRPCADTGGCGAVQDKPPPAQEG